MTPSGISQQVEAYDLWRQSIAKEVLQYLNWLRLNHLNSVELEEQITRRLRELQNDTLTVAFVGEFSRGKTELINALFFTGFGQRMLPSQAGRTTMCPVELFFDTEEGSYVRLLPIDTRQNDQPLSAYREQYEAWVNFTLDPQSPDSVREALEHVAQTRSVTFDQARKLGFDVGTLEADRSHPGHALIPAWRHALISLDHPILRQGLRILDTPGLNALGSEPELTVSMIPSAHAIVFLLGADTGVTASDMQIWTEHLQTQKGMQQSARFAVLNKIDMFWEDIRQESQTLSMIEDMRRKTAQMLEMEPGQVLPLSAKQALIGRIKSDNDLIERSRITALEDLLAEKLLAQKEKLVTQKLVMDVLGLLQTSESILKSRLDSLLDRRRVLHEGHAESEDVKALTDKTQGDYNFYYKKLFTLRSSRRLMHSQAMILERLVNAGRFDAHAARTRDALVNSWTTLGMARAITEFFAALDSDMSNLRHEGRLAQKMVDSIYQRYNDGASAHLIEPPPFNISQQLKGLENLRFRAEKFSLGASTLLSEQTIVVRRFFNTLVAEARKLYLEISAEAQRWPQDALTPLLQNTLEQKQTLEQQIRHLKTLHESAKDIRTQQRKLDTMLDDIRHQLQTAEKIQRRLRKPAPQLLMQKVINLSGASR